MQAQSQHRAAGKETILAFKRHILAQSEGFVCEPAADAFRVNLLAQMLDCYDELQAKGMSELSCRSRTIHMFGDIPERMREMGFEETDFREQHARWPQMTLPEAERFIRERDAYVHRTALGVMLCSACVAPLMIAAAFSEIMSSDIVAMLGLVGMFLMIGMGVYAIVTAAKPAQNKKVNKGQYSLSRSLRRRLEALKDEMGEKARRRKGKGIAVLVTSVIPIFVGAALTEFFGSDFWSILSVSGMFLMIGAGVYELVMADGEKKTIGRLLKNSEE